MKKLMLMIAAVAALSIVSCKKGEDKKEAKEGEKTEQAQDTEKETPAEEAPADDEAK